MDGDRVDAVTEWETVSVGRGHRGLRDLADEGFSGAVTDGRAWALVTNGKVVGVTDGDIDDFADADLTAHRAPDPALPLLFAMQERGGETRARYYTNDTSISEADETLSAGGFTGYVELSENVLSGDYYVVYYGGEAMPVAFIGNSRRLLTGDEAFERADDEVGIYEVREVDVDVVDIPGGAAAGSGAGGATAGGAAATGAGSTDATDATEDVVVGSAAETPDAGAERPSEDETDAADADAAVDETDADAEDAGAAEAGDDAGSDTGDDARSDVGDDGSATDDGPDWPTPDLARDPDDEGDSTAAGETSGAESADSTGANGDEAARSDAEEADPEATTADATGEPTLDPDLTAAGTTEQSSGAADAGSVEDAEATSADASEEGEATGASAATGERVETLEADLTETRERLETVRAERDDLRAEVERLRERVTELERELDDARAAAGGGTEGETLPAEAALAGTNLFVRYRSKAEATLADARDAGADPDTVNDNLRIEHHTTFDAAETTVDGRPFAEFLESSVEYRFVEWLVRELPYELRGVDSRGGLGKLFEAIPSFDRVELDGTVSGDEAEWSFDVVVRDRHGAPLVVADVRDDRSPASEADLSSLVEDAKAACAENESLGGAMLVTTSYFEPDALERADAETAGGGLFGRGRRESYVRLDRSRGFHLCLVEARDGGYHLSVPDL